MAPPSLLLIAALFAVARMEEPRDCQSCASSTETCKGTSVTCSKDQNTCISMVVEHSLTKGKVPVIGSSVSCAASAKSVNSTFMFDFGDKGSLNFTAQLCSGQTCNASFDHVPLEAYLNGISCPKCYMPGYSSCKDNGTVLCSGEFRKCASINGIITEGDGKISFAAKGCAWGSLSDLSKKLPMTIVSDPYNYTLEGLSFYEVGRSFASMGHVVTLSLDSKDLVSQVAFFFPCFLSIFAGKILS